MRRPMAVHKYSGLPLLGDAERSGLAAVTLARTLAHGSMLMTIAATLLVPTYALLEGARSAALLFILFGLTGAALSRLHSRLASRVFLLVFSAASLACVFVYSSNVLAHSNPYYIGGSDDLSYEILGRRFASGYAWDEYGAIRREVAGPFHNSVGYVYVVGLLTSLGDQVGGSHTLVFRLFNALSLGLASLFTYAIGLRIGLTVRRSAAAAVAAGLLPLSLWASAHTFRDSLVTALLMLLLLSTMVAAGIGAAHTRPTRRITAALGIVPVIVALSELRSWYLYVAVAIVCVGASVGATQSGRRSLAPWALAVVLVASAVILMTSGADSRLSEEVAASAAVYAEYRQDIAGEGLSSAVFGVGGVVGYVLRTAYAVVSPLPVMEGGAIQVWLGLGTVVHIGAVGLLIYGLWRSLRRPELWPLLSLFVLIFSGIAYLTFTIRQMVAYLPVAALLVAIGGDSISKSQSARARTLGIGLAAVVLLGVNLVVLGL